MQKPCLACLKCRFRDSREFHKCGIPAEFRRKVSVSPRGSWAMRKLKINEKGKASSGDHRYQDFSVPYVAGLSFPWMISTPRNLWSPCLLLDHKPIAVSKTSLYFVGFRSLYFLAPMQKHIFGFVMNWDDVNCLAFDLRHSMWWMHGYQIVYDRCEASDREKKMFHITRERKFPHYFSFYVLISHLQNLMFLVGCLMPYSGTSKQQEGRISLMKGTWSEYRNGVGRQQWGVCLLNIKVEEWVLWMIAESQVISQGERMFWKIPNRKLQDRLSAGVQWQRNCNTAANI